MEFPDDLLRETGWDQPDFTPLVGGLDPLLVQMVKNAVATTETSDSLYRQTMSISAAAHLTHVLSPRHVPAISIDDRRLRKAIAYIHDNLMGELSLHAMASEAADLGAAPAQGPHRQTGQVRRRWSGRRVRQGTASSDGFSKSFISPERATGPREDETSARMMSQEIM